MKNFNSPVISNYPDGKIWRELFFKEQKSEISAYTLL
jgi:hypothetical protein